MSRTARTPARPIRSARPSAGLARSAVCQPTYQAPVGLPVAILVFTLGALVGAPTLAAPLPQAQPSSEPLLTIPVPARPSSGTHAGTAEDPIPVRAGEIHHGEINEPSPHLDEWISYMAAPFPFPNAVVYRLVPEEAGEFVIQARSLDFSPGLRLSRVMPGGEMISLDFDAHSGWDNGYRIATGSETRPWLTTGHEYRIEVFDWAEEDWPPQSGEFDLVVRRAAGPAGTEGEEETGIKGRPLWWYRIEYLRKVAARARARGNAQLEGWALGVLADVIMSAAVPPGWTLDTNETADLVRFDEVHDIMARLLLLQEEHPSQPVRVALLDRYHQMGAPDEDLGSLRAAPTYGFWGRSHSTWTGITPAQIEGPRAMERESRASGNPYRLWAALSRQIDLHLEVKRILPRVKDGRVRGILEQALLGEDRLGAMEKELLSLAREVPLGSEGLLAKSYMVAARLGGSRGQAEEAERLREESLNTWIALHDSVEERLRRADYEPGLGRLLRRRAEWFFGGLREAPESRKAYRQEALEIAEAEHDKGHSLPLAYHLLTAEGPRGEQLPGFDRAIEILEEAYGPAWIMKVAGSFWRRLTGLGGVAAQYSFAGRAKESIEIREQSLARTGHRYGSYGGFWEYDAASHARALGELGLFEKALPLVERALEIQRRSGWPSNQNLLMEGYVLSDALLAVGAEDRALRFAREIVARAMEQVSRFGADDPTAWSPMMLALSRDWEGRALAALGRHGEARDSWQQGLAVLGEDVGVFDQARCLIHPGLAAVSLLEGDPATAEDHVREAVRACSSAYGPGSNWERRATRVLPAIEAELGKDQSLATAVAQDLERSRRLRLTSSSFSEKVVLGFSSSGAGTLPGLEPPPGRDVALSLLARPEASGEPAEGADTVLDALIRSRAVILDEVGARNRTLSGASGPAVSRAWEAYREAARRAANIMVGSRRDPKLLEATLEELDGAEQALARASGEFRKDRATGRAGLEEVRSALPGGSALVAYQAYDHVEFQPGPGDAKRAPLRERITPHYAAFVLADGQTSPVLVPLGDASSIDGAVNDWQEALMSDRRALRGMGAVKTAGSEGRAEREREPSMRFRDAGAALRALVWDPIAAHVDDAERVFVVPDGALNLVSFAALPDGEEGWLVESGPVLHYLSAERDLVRAALEAGEGATASQTQESTPFETSAPASSRTLLALGGADFDTGAVFAALRSGDDATGRATATVASAPTTDSEPGSESDPGVEVAAAPAATSSGGARPSGIGVAGEAATKIPFVSAFRGERSGCEAFADHSFDALSQTRAEVEEIARVWQDAGREAGVTRTGDPASRASSRSASNARAFTLLGADATESAFKMQAPDSSVVHVATHGFFLDGKCTSALDETRGFGGVVTAENPLVLSGLALAGANNREHAGENEDDGILTAQEIAAMDLSSVEWAVLSACDTGVGEIRAGEGVFGLRRAFQVAGADTLIMSLWSVEDEATRAWMKALYEGRLVKKMDTAAAVRHASLTVLNDRRESGLPDHPFYWAAFVAAGDWR